ncbi:TIGR04282 family arsenosugar biosynthesis glycosyltransferase [Promicromonospora kroppenstedtii]|uniref:TIGR04282 family arsenosugar biosynthesis glycosyltransferase n=1 Tax=Promicromonospora kroppenstedtii TaxID=440482 RepID=UPI0004B0B5E0|nr:DUF2064 domain-containing protein [Promicromonospora kroppenstedtii]
MTGTTLPRTVMVLAKEPRPGKVKTRLIGDLTAAEAAALAQAALADTLKAVDDLPGVRRLLVLDGRAGPWVLPGFVVVPQVGGGLDRRIAAAFDHALGPQGYPGPALLVGMDTPQLGPVLPAVDFAGHDAVLGLADDGGYWAVGLRQADPALFHGVPMSEPVTGEAQLARLRGAGLTVRLLPTLRDVDTVRDAAAVARAAPGTRFARTWSGVAHRVSAGDVAEGRA